MAKLAHEEATLKNQKDAELKEALKAESMYPPPMSQPAYFQALAVSQPTYVSVEDERSKQPRRPVAVVPDVEPLGMVFKEDTMKTFTRRSSER